MGQLDSVWNLSTFIDVAERRPALGEGGKTFYFRYQIQLNGTI